MIHILHMDIFLISSFLQQLKLSALKLEVDINFPSELEAKRVNVLMYSKLYVVHIKGVCSNT